MLRPMPAGRPLAPSPTRPVAESSLAEVVRYFFRLGSIAFGGPAVHIAMMRRELVAERQWVTDEEFVDLLGVTNLIPGPNSTELAMHLGSARAGWRGLWLGGLAFIAPAIAIVLGIAWAYVEYGDTPAGEALIYGIQPFMLAIIVQAIWGLRRAAVKGVATFVTGVAVVVLAVAGADEVSLILGAGVAMVLWRGASGGPGRALLRWIRAIGTRARAASSNHAVLVTPAGYSLAELFFVFLKIGAVLYGSGYVLVAFIQSDLVDHRQWLTNGQLVDAIAVGQFTPGPVFSSATFVGYVIDGWQGAAVATAGIFLPSFFFVAVTHPLVPRLRRWPWTAPFLDGVNVAAIALMGVVTFDLARHALDDAFAISLFAAASLLLIRYSPNSAWLVLAGVVAGLLHAWAT